MAFNQYSPKLVNILRRFVNDNIQSRYFRLANQPRYIQSPTGKVLIKNPHYVGPKDPKFWPILNEHTDESQKDEDDKYDWLEADAGY